jgi:hypothetical protein
MRRRDRDAPTCRCGCADVTGMRRRVDVDAPTCPGCADVSKRGCTDGPTWMWNREDAVLAVIGVMEAAGIA